MTGKTRVTQQTFNFMKPEVNGGQERPVDSAISNLSLAQDPRDLGRQLSKDFSPEAIIPYKIGVQNEAGGKLGLKQDQRSDDLHLIQFIYQALTTKGISDRNDAIKAKFQGTILLRVLPEFEHNQEDAIQKLRQMKSTTSAKDIDYSLENMLVEPKEFKPSKKDELNAAASFGFVFEYYFQKQGLTTEQRLNLFVNYINSLIAFVKNINQNADLQRKPEAANHQPSYIAQKADYRELQLPTSDRLDF
jgi:hypothetical protein